MPRRPTRTNPVTGYHPDLLPHEHRWPKGVASEGAQYEVDEERRAAGESPIFVPLEDLTPEQIEQLPVKAFTPDEWDQLDEDQQEAIFENDASSQERITAFVDIFVSQWKWAQDPDRHDWSEVEDGFENWLASAGDSLWRQMPRARLSALIDYANERRVEVQAVRNRHGDITIGGEMGDEFTAAVTAAMENSNRYEIDMDTDEPVYSEERRGYVYVESMEYRREYDALTPAEVERAIARVADETNHDITIDPRRLERNRPIEEEWDTGVTIKMGADWDTIETEIREAIDEFAPKSGGSAAYEAIADRAPQERVVHRWPDGFYVQDLLAEELKAEGEAMGMCVGRADMGYDEAVREGRIKIMSLRRPSGKPLFTIELELDDDGKVTKIEQVKGKANRLPGFDRGQLEKPLKRDEVERVLEFIEGPLVEYEAEEAGRRRGEGIRFEDVDDLRPAARQVHELYRAGDPWAIKLASKLKRDTGSGLGPLTHRLPDPRGNPAPVCKIHGERCGGFCSPYRPRR